ncbi:MAG: hypothetical protein H7839_07855 [Magnetococcus sp. YQC-5]
MKHSDYQKWVAQIDKLTPVQREQAMAALAQWHAEDVLEPTFYSDEESSFVSDEDDPTFFSDMTQRREPSLR